MYRQHVPAPRRYVTDAIVLSRFDYGEADRILTLMTPSGGRLAAANEVDDARFVTLAEARELLSYRRDVELLDSLAEPDG